MATETEKQGQRYLPMTPEEAVVQAGCGLSGDDVTELGRVAGLLRAIGHATYRERWQQAKDAYEPFSSEAGSGTPAEAGADAHDRLVAELRDVLDAANYDELPPEVLQHALDTSSVAKVRLRADLDEFADLLLFRRGTAQRHTTISRFHGLRTREVDYLEYDRVVMYARYRDAQYYLDAGRGLDELPFTPGRSFLKLFQHVPADDVEMLLPNTDVSMRLLDKLLIGVPAVVGGIAVGVTKLAAALVLIFVLVGALLGLRSNRPDLDTGVVVTLLGGLAAFGAYLWRQWAKYKSRRIRYMKTLSETRYFKTLGAGAGVLFTVLDAAEEADFKEALLAYRGLLDGARAAADLDRHIESQLREQCGVVDFEVSDALGKLERLGLAHRLPDESWEAEPPAHAVTILRACWRELGDALAESAGQPASFVPSDA